MANMLWKLVQFSIICAIQNTVEETIKHFREKYNWIQTTKADLNPIIKRKAYHVYKSVYQNYNTPTCLFPQDNTKARGALHPGFGSC